MINAQGPSQQGIKKKNRKGKKSQLLEYGAVYALLFLARCIPLTMVYGISRFLGNLLYRFVKKRRTIALENLKNTLGSEKTDQEIGRSPVGAVHLSFAPSWRLRNSSICSEPLIRSKA